MNNFEEAQSRIEAALPGCQFLTRAGSIFHVSTRKDCIGWDVHFHRFGDNAFSAAFHLPDRIMSEANWPELGKVLEEVQKKIMKIGQPVLPVT